MIKAIKKEKVMQIKPVISKIVNRVEDIRANRLDKIAKKHVQIHNDYWMKDDTLNQILKAQRALGNYARKENVKIDIYRGDHILGDLTTGREENAVANKLFVTVTDLSNSKQKQALIPDQVSKIYLNQKVGYRIYDTSDETQQGFKYICESHEDSFIRNFYRKISEMVNSLKEQKKK